MRNRCRKYFYWLHLHLGLWIGVLFVLLGITGSLLTFYPEIDLLINPNIKPVALRHSEVSVQRVYEVLRRDFPERTGGWRIELPMSAKDTVSARYYKPVETAHKKFAPIMVTIDPVAYKVTSSRFWGDYFATWIYDLHYTLLADEIGHDAVGLIGFFMLGAILLGYWLWMPKWGRVVQSLRPIVRGQKVKKIYDLHMIFGVYSGIFITVLAVTGVILAYPQFSKSLASSVLTFEQPMPKFHDLKMPMQDEADLDSLIQIAYVVFPQSEVRWIESSGADGGEVTLRIYNGNEPSRRFPQTYLKLHPVTGQVLYQRNYHQLPLGDTVWAWVHPLHNGEAFGLFGRLFVSVIGLIPLVMFLTGVIRYGQKRRAKFLANSHKPK